MNPTPSNRAVITFYSNLGEVVRISIPRARMDNTADEARTAMEAIIENGAVITTAGIPADVRSAELVSTSRTPIVPASA